MADKEKPSNDRDSKTSAGVDKRNAGIDSGVAARNAALATGPSQRGKAIEAGVQERNSAIHRGVMERGARLAGKSGGDTSSAAPKGASKTAATKAPAGKGGGVVVGPSGRIESAPAIMAPLAKLLNKTRDAQKNVRGIGGVKVTASASNAIVDTSTLQEAASSAQATADDALTIAEDLNTRMGEAEGSIDAIDALIVTLFADLSALTTRVSNLETIEAGRESISITYCTGPGTSTARNFIVEE